MTSSRNVFVTSTPLSAARVPTERRNQREVSNDSMENQVDDENLAMAISISEEVERRKSANFISTQEYREDENRRSLLIDHVQNDSQKDMFAETDSGIEKNLGSGSKSEMTNSPNEDDDFINTADETMNRRWCGDAEDLMMPETRSCFVGQRPAPSVVVRLQHDSVSNESRTMKSFSSSSQLPSNPAPAQSFLVAVELMRAGIEKNALLKRKVSLPLKLQLVGQRVEVDETVVLELSDGTNIEEFFMCEKYAFLFRLNKIAMNMLMTVTELEMSNQRGKVIKTMKLEKWSSGKIGNPVKL